MSDYLIMRKLEEIDEKINYLTEMIETLMFEQEKTEEEQDKETGWKEENKRKESDNLYINPKK